MLELNFVVPEERLWPEIRDGRIGELTPQQVSKRTNGAVNSLVIRTGFELHKRGWVVHWSNSMKKDIINVGGVKSFSRKMHDRESYLVLFRGDAFWPALANFKIQQCGQHTRRHDAGFLPMWTQPGIVPRNPDRGSKIVNLCYKGRIGNLDERFRSEKFRSELSRRGIQLMIDDLSDEGNINESQAWNDYSCADLVIAARNLTVYDARKKPASKLVNAWLARVPALLGPEPAFREMRKSKLDYFEILDARDALVAIDSLQSSPELYQEVVRQCALRASEVNDDATARMWTELFLQKILPSYQRWLRYPVSLRHSAFNARVIVNRCSRVLDGLLIRNGPRILRSDSDTSPELESGLR